MERAGAGPPERRDGGSEPAPEATTPTRRERLRAGRDEVRRRVHDQRRRLDHARERSPVLDAAMTSYEQDVEAGGSVLAAAVGFRMFLFLVPFVFVFVAGFGLAADATDSSPREVARDLDIGGLVAQSISDVAGGSAWERILALVVGALATFLAARALAKVLWVSHSLVWGVPVRSQERMSVRALGVIGMVALLVVGGAVLGEFREDSFLGGLVATILYSAVFGACWLTCSFVLPHSGVRWQDLIPGAVLVAVGTEALHLATVYWFARLISSKSQTYGSIGAAIAILLWAYFVGRLIVSSAVLNASRARSAS